MFTNLSHKLTSLTLALCAIVLCSLTALAQEFPNDLKPGSVLFFNRYTSSSSNPSAQDTQINLTNVSATQPINVHLFFVDGSTCSVADSYIGLTQSQTASFLASDFDPGTTGYLVAVATSGGSPAFFNNLLGTAYIREADGKLADIPAVTIQKISPGPVAGGLEGTATLIFNNIEYGRLPAMVAISAFNSQVTDNTMFSLYSPAANLLIGESDISSIFGILYDQLEKPYSLTFRISCYSTFTLRSLRIIGGGIANVIPAGSTGWLKMSATNGRPLMGVVMNRGPVFIGGRNLSILTLATTYSITVPVF